MRCIGIIGAMEVEVASLKEQMKDIQVTRKASMEFYSGIIEGKNVVVVRSGIGKVNGSYGTYKYWNFTANNATSLSKTIDVAVPSGTYYRVRGYHAASQSGTKESTSTLTQGIMVK